MKRDTVDRLLRTAHHGRDALSRAQMLSGSPVLARGERGLAVADPLEAALAQSCCPGAAALLRGGSSSDHGSPERERFYLPLAVPQVFFSKEGDADDR